MTIFSVLKYSLSDPPTLEEIKALPPTVFHKTINRFNHQRIKEESLASLLDTLYRGRQMHSYTEYMEELKKNIRDYEGDE